MTPEFKRVFLLIIDSMGCGDAPDADRFDDVGSNTLRTISYSEKFNCPNLESLGLFYVDGFKKGEPYYRPEKHPEDAAPAGSATSPADAASARAASSIKGVYGRLQEVSAGKDTTAGHWEIAGLVMPRPFPTYPEGFPPEVIGAFEELTGRGTLCNKPYSGTDVIRDYGEEHLKTGKLIVYTSADSVFQIAAHEEIVPPEELYRYCRIAREILQGDHGVGRVIARPFIGHDASDFERVGAHRHDFSLVPPLPTMMDELTAKGFASIGIGKIRDIFAGKGLETTYTTPTTSNEDGLNKTLALMKEDFRGLCFVNLVETDSVFGHRRDIDGYANAVSVIDRYLGEMIARAEDTDVIMIAADHGCDPGFKGTDHTREYIPLLMYGKQLKAGTDLGTRKCFGDIGATILDMFGISYQNITGKSFLGEIV